ncbi:hypothetical protein DL764_007366 [Monosporascus ibericus]|uniref:Uncharacterized protein n=1 Tax=Monosporascus ibericus TaxID=155417 RepID=A0A4Q4T1I3_9PEZI|nr:hypothetical protein DL764_007366 [Monosporascus ibericus]
MDISSDAGSIKSRVLQWQVHPAEDGPLRYTLVRLGSGEKCTNDSIEAIYYDMGWEKPLARGYNEGVLLLPGSGIMSSTESFIVSSTLAILAELRGLYPYKPQRARMGHRGSKVQRMKTMFHWVLTTRGEE